MILQFVYYFLKIHFAQLKQQTMGSHLESYKSKRLRHAAAFTAPFFHRSLYRTSQAPNQHQQKTPKSSSTAFILLTDCNTHSDRSPPHTPQLPKRGKATSRQAQQFSSSAWRRCDVSRPDGANGAASRRRRDPRAPAMPGSPLTLAGSHRSLSQHTQVQQHHINIPARPRAAPAPGTGGAAPAGPSYPAPGAAGGRPRCCRCRRRHGHGRPAGRGSRRCPAGRSVCGCV